MFRRRFTMSNHVVTRALAAAFLAGDLSKEAIIERAARVLGRPWRWLPPLAARYVAAMEGKTRPRLDDVVEFLKNDDDFFRACLQHRVAVERWLIEPHRMQPVAAAAGWDLPAIESAGDLADWLGVTPSELDWYADLKGLTLRRGADRLSHYHHRVLHKQSGAVRLIESPKENLKAIQTRILRGILNRVPAHDAAHGFVRGRSIKTFVAPHAGQRVVLRMDLQDFFPTFSGVRIQAFFRTLGYPESVADLLGGLCTTRGAGFSPREALASQSRIAVEAASGLNSAVQYQRPHLPQGAPTSPALANACMYRVDCRLFGYAEAAGARFTRYADDLAFSGDLSFARFSAYIAAILEEEGFSVNYRKTRIMRQGVRQHLAGLVANEHPNIIRDHYDRLKAILTNCIRHGPASQNRDSHPDFRAHLLGRISFVASINPTKGHRLRKIFEQIFW